MRRASLWWLTGLSMVAYVIASGVMLVPGGALEGDLLTSWLYLLLVAPAFVAGGLILTLKRPGHPVGELLLALAVVGLVLPTVLEVAVNELYHHRGPQDWMWLPMWVHQTLGVMGAVLAATMIALLPDGRLRSLRERRFLVGLWVLVGLPTLSLFSNPTLVRHQEFSFPTLSNVASPLVVEPFVPYGGLIAGLSTFAYAAAVGGGLLLLILRMRTATRRERKQVRWVLFAGMVALVVLIGPMLLTALGIVDASAHEGFVGYVSVPIMLLFPAGVLAAVLEPAWLDVDVVIRRSFVYGVLSFLILILYAALASAMGLAAGSRLPLEVAVVTTVVVAVVFQPLRRRLQTIADRWVFGERPSELEVLTDFAAALGTSSDPTDLSRRLAETLTGALDVRWAAVEVVGEPPVASGDRDGDPALIMPIVHQDEDLGSIACGPKREGPLVEAETRLVGTLADQVALALSNARLAGRVVAAQEAERRRIERNIHDGAQQELVALVARLGLARARARSGTVNESDLAELQRETRRILTDLRDFAQGIHPTVLTDAGLLEAIEDLCGRLPVPVTLDAPAELRRTRFPDEVEGGGYFFTTEGIANILKHARATRIGILLRFGDGRLTIEVRDDGVGFDPNGATGNGLAGLADRVSALGGSFAIESELGGGTALTAVLPVDGDGP
jgi:signal transduction histidine kinase